MAKPKPLKVDALDPALTRADVELLIADLGNLQRDEAAAVADAEAARAAADVALATKLQPIRASIDAKAAVVFAWAAKHRGEICDKGSKTATLATGEIAWRMTPKSVAIKGVETVLALLKKGRLKRFLRVKVEIDKAALLREEKAALRISGISISQREEVVLKPNQNGVPAVELVAKAS